MLLLLLTATLLATAAEPAAEETATDEPRKTKDVKVPGVDLMVRLPLPETETELPLWGHSLGDATSEVKLGLRRIDAFTDLRVQTTA